MSGFSQHLMETGVPHSIRYRLISLEYHSLERDSENRKALPTEISTQNAPSHKVLVLEIIILRQSYLDISRTVSYTTV